MLHWNQRVLLTEYVKPHFPSEVYKYDLHHGSAAHKVGHEHDRLVATWLEGVNPPLPTSIALGVVDTQRCGKYCLVIYQLRYVVHLLCCVLHAICKMRIARDVLLQICLCKCHCDLMCSCMPVYVFCRAVGGIG